jgi:hypothetical protein
MLSIIAVFAMDEGISERNNPSIFVFPASIKHRYN